MYDKICIDIHVSMSEHHERFPYLSSHLLNKIIFTIPLIWWNGIVIVAGRGGAQLSLPHGLIAKPIMQLQITNSPTKILMEW